LQVIDWQIIIKENGPAVWKTAYRLLGSYADAAILLIAAGYISARLSAPKSMNVQQIQAAIEPAIREQIVAQLRQDLLTGLANGYVQLKDELTEQYHQDLNQAAIQTVAVSGKLTNQLLAELIESINASQVQDRQWIMAALKQIDSNQRQDSVNLSNAFVTFAAQTEDELLRTKQNIAKLLSDSQAGNVIPKEDVNSNNPN
jgi:hypothetical protein